MTIHRATWPNSWRFNVWFYYVLLVLHIVLCVNFADCKVLYKLYCFYQIKGQNETTLQPTDMAQLGVCRLPATAITQFKVTTLQQDLDGTSWNTTIVVTYHTAYHLLAMTSWCLQPTGPFCRTTKSPASFFDAVCVEALLHSYGDTRIQQDNGVQSRRNFKHWFNK